MSSYSWVCPYCHNRATITPQNQFKFHSSFYTSGNIKPFKDMEVTVVSCPNPKCAEYTVSMKIYGSTEPNKIGSKEDYYKIRPNSYAKNFPSYIPAPLLDDYRESCLIRDLSPKASATLARRCLQGMIRDFWGVSKPRLVDEIKAIEDKVDGATWRAIDAVRQIGNIGAHMEKDIDLVIDVDPNEAQLLIGLIELLFQEWYVARADREERVNSIVQLAQAKNEIKQQGRSDV